MPTWRPEFVEFVHLLAAMRDAGIEAPDAGTVVEPFAASQFDATILGALALEAAGPDPDPAHLRAGFLSIARGGHAFGVADLPEMFAAMRRGEDVDYAGASGNVEVDDDGDVRADIVTWAVKNGRIVETGRVRLE
jgi:hypothetical protein